MMNKNGHGSCRILFGERKNTVQMNSVKWFLNKKRSSYGVFTSGIIKKDILTVISIP